MSLMPFFYDVNRRPFGLFEDCFRDHHSRGMLSPFLNHCGMGGDWQSLSKAMNQLGFNDITISTGNEDMFQVNVDVHHFSPEEISVKVVDGHVLIEGKHEEKRDEHGYVTRQFVRKYALPEGCLPDTVESKLSSDGVLIVTAPKVLALPSTGEKIVPIAKSGPVRKQISCSSPAEEGVSSEK